MRKFIGADYTDYFIQENSDYNVCGENILTKFTIKVAFYIFWIKFYTDFGHNWNETDHSLGIYGERFFKTEKFDNIEAASKRYKSIKVANGIIPHYVNVCQKQKEIVIREEVPKQ